MTEPTNPADKSGDSASAPDTPADPYAGRGFAAPGEPVQEYPAYPMPPAPGGYPPPPTGFPPAPPQPYAGYGAPMVAAPKNGFGVAALIVGLLSLGGFFCFGFGGFIVGLVAIVLGFVGRAKAGRGEATNGGMATGGIVLGVVGILVNIAVLVFGFHLFNQFGGRDLMDCLREAGNDKAAQQACQREFEGNLENRLSITLTPTR